MGPDDGKNPIVSYSLLTNDNSYIPTSINEPAKIKTWLYPNPTQEMSYLNVVIDNEDYVSINVYDIAGRLIDNIFEGRIDKFKDFNIGTSNFETGLYLIGIETPKGSKTLKLKKL